MILRRHKKRQFSNVKYTTANLKITMTKDKNYEI